MKTMNISVTEEQVKLVDKLVVEFGFANRSELVRKIFRRLKSDTQVLEEPPVQLSEKAIKRYNKMDEDIASGKEPLYVAEDVNDLLDQLHGRKSPVLTEVPKKLRKKNKAPKKAVKKVRRASSNVYSRPQTQAS
jgi:Arc/MetJ-type ribon-helix-helix transcriptional regulator